MVAYTANPADTAGGVDAESEGMGRSPADTAGGVDSAGAGQTRTLADTAGAVDVGLITFGPNPADTAGVAGSFGVVQTQAPAPTDRAAASDNATHVLVRTGISDYQFVINREPWVPFGQGQAINVQTFDMGVATPRIQDQESEVADVTLMGLDFKTPPVWSWQCNTDVTNEHEALGWVEDLAEAWDPEDIRGTPNAVVELLYRIDGRQRVVYGRPRNFTPQPGNTRQGTRLISLDFKLAEDVMYEADWQSMTTWVQTQANASVFPPFPWSFPITSSATINSPTGQLIIGGRKPTWLLAAFTGPLDNPVLTIGAQRWGLRGSVPANRTVTICGMPWDLGVVWDDGTYAPGMLDPRARLSQFKLPPGQYPVVLYGDNATATSRVDLYWRPAYRAH